LEQPRLDGLIHRPVESRETILRLGSLELDLIKRAAKRGERAIDLLPREFRLLEYMTQRNDQSLTRADVHMGRLRLKVRHAE
jgi:two-component system OmpR family response regulator